MMTVEGMAGLGRGVFQHDATQLVIRNAVGTPIVIVVEHGGAVLVSCPGDDDYDEVCKAMNCEVEIIPKVIKRGA